MTGFTALNEFLDSWAGSNARRKDAAITITNLAAGGVELASITVRGALAGDIAAATGAGGGGDVQKVLDKRANEIFLEALRASPVAWIGSEEDDGPVAATSGGSCAVSIDPLDGSSNIDTNVTVGTIFSILPADGENPLLQPGRNQIAAGFIAYGPQTTLTLTVGDGVQLFLLDPVTRGFVLVQHRVTIPPATREFAINASNERHWDAAVSAYVRDCKRGAEGPLGADYNFRWVGSMVADASRILRRGGVFLYPGDKRKGYEAGRLRLLYETSPLAMIVEQAGGAAITGKQRVLDVVPEKLHQRCPFIFGSSEEVARIAKYYESI